MQSASPFAVLLMLLCATLPGIAVQASGVFSVSDDIREAYQLTFELKLAEAATKLESIEARDPDNLMALYIADFIDFFKVLIEDDVDGYQAIKADREIRLRLLTLGDVSSPYYLYVQAESYIHRAILRVKFDENFAAASDLNQAFRLLKRNQRRFPDFSPNLKSLGMLKAAFGTIPDTYRWAVELLSSMEGTVDEGMDDLRAALQDKDQLTYRETQYYYMLGLVHYQNAADQALAYATTSGIRASSNILNCFVLSHIALKSGQNDLALQWLEESEQRGELTAVPHLALMYGTARLHHLDDDAHVPLLLFLNLYDGKNYRKEALQKLAWHALIHGDPSGYAQYMLQCRQEGCELLESDHYAMAEACAIQPPDPQLLKARLLFDGGYYLRALEVIEEVPFDHLTAVQQLEYRYRSGRIYKELGREYDALFAFKMTITGGSDSKEYYACAAALYAGQLYEGKGDSENAQRYYQMSVNMSPDSYRSGLHQKAKAGMSRLKGR